MNMENKFIAKCTSLNEYGQGVVNYNNSTFIVDNLLINEEAELIITKKTHKYYLARVHKLITKSKDRNEVKCNSKCGGCDLIHLNYDKQLEFKNEIYKQLENLTDGIVIASLQKGNSPNTECAEIFQKFHFIHLIFPFFEKKQPVSLPTALSCISYTSSRRTSIAASPLRRPILTILV